MKKIVIISFCLLLISSFYFISSVHAEAEAVTFSNVRVSGYAPDSFILEFDTNIPAFVNVSYSASPECVNTDANFVFCSSLTEGQVPILKTKTTKHKFYVSGGVGTWIPGNKVWYQLYSSGNVGTSQIYEYIIPQTTTKLNINNFSTEKNTDNITVNWQTDRPATTKVYLVTASDVNYPDRNSWGWSKEENLKVSDNNLTQNHQATITGLNKGIKYAINIENYDSNNNYAQKNGIYSTATDTGYKISNVFAVSLSDSSEKVSWMYGPDNTLYTTEIYVEYGKTAAYGQKVKGWCGLYWDYELLNNCSATLTDLDPGTIYHYRVVYELQNFSDQTFTTTGTSSEPSTPPTTPSTPPTTQPTTPTPITSVTEFVEQEKELVTNIDTSLVKRMNGYILLQVEENGESWYVDSITDQKYYLPDGMAAYSALRKFGLGITNADLAKIPVGIESRFADVDTDKDGLPDKLEEGLGTDPNNADSDGDSYTDLAEILAGYNPLGSDSLNLDSTMANRLKGRIVLQVQSRGEAWYINPKDGKRYYMKDGEAAYQIMRFLSLGITNTDLRTIPVGML